MDSPALIDAYPHCKRGDVAVWSVKHIPEGVRRFGIVVAGSHCPTMADVQRAFSFAGGLVMLHRSFGSGCAPDQYIAAVLWADLQPMVPVPRGRATMLPAFWGQHRDADGVCCVCGADDSMWCDEVSHKNRAIAAHHGATLVITQYDDIQTRYSIQTTPRRYDPRRRETYSLAACTGELIDRRGVSAEARERWATQLRQLQADAAERERNRVLVDLEFEPWE